MDRSSRETCEPPCETFRKHSADLLTAIQDPEVLAWELYSKSVISSAVVEFANNMTHERGERTTKLLMAVGSQIAVDPGVFDVFLSVLANRPAMSDLCGRMKDTPPAKRPRTIMHPQTVQPFDFQYNHQTPVLQYASYLKSVYTREKRLTYDKWPKVKSKKYINLAVIEKEGITKREAYQFTKGTIHGNIDDIKKSKQATDIGQIAQLPDGSQPNCILVEGAPGVGKSTFAWKLCRKWKKGKLLQQYQLVVLLRLRDKSVRAAKNISDLFQYHDHQIQQAVIEEIQSTWGKGVLLLFEGYDELPDKLRTESSVFLDVITGRELPEATVLITSRPWASEFLHRECKRHISQHIEILGFTKDNIQSYLESTIPDDPSLLADLKKYISCYPHINSMMYIPLNSAIVVEVYRNSRKEETLVPKTMTELFSSLVRSLLLRHLFDHPVHGKKRRWRVCSFNDLPQDVYQQLCELGRIAYEGILHDQEVIFSDLPEDFETLGLMQCAVELYADEGATVSYNFLHLAVQEYLAAFHLSQQPVDKQIEHFKDYKNHMNYHKRHRFHMVLLFLCGLRKFSGYPSEVLKTLCVEVSGNDFSSHEPDVKSSSDSSSDSSSESVDDSASDEESGNDSHVIHEITFNTLHWLFEAKDNDVIANLLGSVDIQLNDKKYSIVTPFDCFVLGYCVSHSNCTWKIARTIDKEGVEMLVRGAVEEETHCTGGISEINLTWTVETSHGMEHLLNVSKQLGNIFQLEALNLDFNCSINSESCATLAHLTHLKKLELFSSGEGGAAPLIDSLIAHKSLEELLLPGTKIGNEDCQAVSKLLSSSTRLKVLDVSQNGLDSKDLELIISGLHHNTTLEKLDMSESLCSLQNTISLASVLRTNHTLVYLDLRDCDIDSDGACQLASALCTNDTLQELDLSYNLLFSVGSEFAEMLLKNKSLQYLYLENTSIFWFDVQDLIDSLTHNTTMKGLYLPEKYDPENYKFDLENYTPEIDISKIDSSRVSFE